MKSLPSLAAFTAAFALALVPLHAANVYVLDPANTAVLQVTPAGSVSTFLQDAVHFANLSDIAFGPDGTLFAEGKDATSRGFVYRHSPAGLWDGIYFEGNSSKPLQSIASDPLGNIVLRIRNGQIANDDVFLRWDAGTLLTSPFGFPATHLNGVNGTTFDGIGNFYYSNGGVITRMAPDLTGVTLPGGPVVVSNFAADLAGNFYGDMIVDGVHGIYRVERGSTTLIAPDVFGFMAIDAAGDIYVNQAGTLLQVTPGGTVTPIATGLPNQAIATIIPEPTSALLLVMAATCALATTRRHKPRQTPSR